MADNQPMSMEGQPMRLTLILGTREADALVRLALREDRPPRHQAERLLRAALVGAGDLIDEFRPADQTVYANAAAR